MFNNSSKVTVCPNIPQIFFCKRVLINQAVLTISFFLMASSFSVAADNSAFAWANAQHFGSTSQYSFKKAHDICMLDKKFSLTFIIKIANDS